MVQKIELRIHAGAPSNRSNDERNRALAEAYLGFLGRRPDDGPSDSDHDVAQVPQSEDDSLHEESIGASITVIHREETTFIEDTQLAYDALESQLQTSSLTVPEITPLKRKLPSDDEDDGSPWPESLDQHSPQKRSGGGTQAPPSSPPIAPSPAADPVSKRPRLQQKPFKQPVFKPFKIPSKRSEVPDDPASSAPAFRKFVTPEPARRATSESVASLSSYLKTPILVTPEQARPSKPNAVGLPPQPAPTFSAGKPSSSKLPDYRERTPRRQPLVPYVPFPEGNKLGLAYVGEPSETARSPAQVESHRQSQVSGSGNETTSELPTSYSLSDMTSQSSRARLLASQRSTSDPGPMASNSNGSVDPNASARSASVPFTVTDVPAVVGNILPGSKASNSEPRVASQTMITRQSTLPVHAAATRKAFQPPLPSNNVPTPKVPVPEAPSQHLEAPGVASSSPRPHTDCDFAELPVTICPPEPAVGTGKFSTHVTVGLRRLIESAELASIWHPVATARAPLPLERGYWLVKTHAWSRDIQSGFWYWLQRFVGSGQAGWGVWCTQAMNPEPDDMRNDGLGDVKVYCWGEVVQHIYLLLYVASQSKVRKIGLQWVDAGGEVVVQMRSG